MKKKGFILTIDGPAASGKSTTARLVAEKMGWLYLDTGAMYRALTVKVLRENIFIDDHKEIGLLADRSSIELIQGSNGIKVLLDNEDISSLIRTPEIDKAVGPVCEVPHVREVLVSLQRDLSINGSIVAEGRDMGTVVFPEADLKIFMTASIEDRAERRLKDMKKSGVNVSREELIKQIKNRDKRDAERAQSPLKQAEDSIIIDTSKKNIAEQVNFVLRQIERIKEKYESND